MSATRPMPEHLIAMLEKAIGHQNSGQLAEAANLYQQVLQADPNNTFANHLFGVIHLQTGDPIGAVRLIETAVKHDPGNSEMLNNLSNALIGAGRAEDAERAARLALEFKPDYPEALNTLGKLLVNAGQFTQAEQNIRRAIELKPTLLSAHNNLGYALQGLARVNDAELSFRRALEMNATYPEAVNNLGNLLMAEGRSEEAEQTYRSALEAMPDNVELLTSYGGALQHLERIEEAEACFRSALEIQPGHIRALGSLANAQLGGGFYRQAMKTYDQAIALAPQDTGLRVKRALALPIIPASLEEIQCARTRLLANVEELIASGASLIDPAAQANITGFYLAYHNQNDVLLVQKIAQMYLQLCPSLSWSAEPFEPKGTGGKYRIGFLSFHFYDHTIGKLCRGIIEHLDPEKFEVIVFRTSSKSDPMAEAIEAAAAKVVTLQQNLDSARQAVSDEKLDLLYYPDVGMDAFTYYLAFARLAPVQVTSWGHPMSTGIPNMDYFISSKDLETEDGDAHYSETLVRLAHPPTYYYRPEIPSCADARTVHGLSATDHLYLCPQTLFKFHPRFDSLLGDILRGDPAGVLVLLAGRYPSKERLLRERFALSFPDVLDRVVFLPRMKMADFLGLVCAADVVLDPVCFSGGNSTAETFALGIPIVTWPDQYLRDRVTYAFYKTMGIDDLIATSASDYVSIAHRLAKDPDFHARMSQRIKDNAGCFFENIEVVRELEGFMIAAIEAERADSGPVKWGGRDTGP